jgi:hypothetical protein
MVPIYPMVLFGGSGVEVVLQRGKFVISIEGKNQPFADKYKNSSFKNTNCEYLRILPSLSITPKCSQCL